MTTTRTLHLADGQVAWREVEGEIVGVALGKGEYFAVTPSGAALWAALAEGTTHAALVELLRQRFGISEEIAVRDVTAFVESLDGWGLLAP